MILDACGDVHAVDVAYVQRYYDVGRPVFVQIDKNKWAAGKINRCEQTHYVISYSQENLESALSSDVEQKFDIFATKIVPYEEAREKVKLHFVIGTLVKAWNSLLGCWQIAEVLGTIKSDDSVQLPDPDYVEIFCSCSRTRVLKFNHVRHLPQGELDELMYKHAIRLKVCNFHLKLIHLIIDH